MKLFEFCPAIRTPFNEVVVGVRGKEFAEVISDSRLIALLRGRKIPAPSIEV